MADPFGDVGSFDDGGDLGDYSDNVALVPGLKASGTFAVGYGKAGN
ncbi:hypothetical protein GCM10011608_59660 [Micromonospora sonchi]|uniref:Uncharacterized protein n=1 Tax=Micromonospora sonchi TaxID=1763543 RepID=A0A917X4V1_9ACTN|nr:hypothetical protein [Micromonospora sonchi]GGM66491.1 hypothetical protein GCM10011608_59660 [Micromonospora sonchi]